MGQPMLPFLAGTAGGQLDSSDSEIEVPVTPVTLSLLFLHWGLLKVGSVTVALPLVREICSGCDRKVPLGFLG